MALEILLKKKVCLTSFLKKINITFLQETLNAMEIEKQWGCEWNSEVLYSHGSSRNFIQQKPTVLLQNI